MRGASSSRRVTSSPASGCSRASARRAARGGDGAGGPHLDRPARPRPVRRLRRWVQGVRRGTACGVRRAPRVWASRDRPRGHGPRLRCGAPADNRGARARARAATARVASQYAAPEVATAPDGSHPRVPHQPARVPLAPLYVDLGLSLGQVKTPNFQRADRVAGTLGARPPPWSTGRLPSRLAGGRRGNRQRPARRRRRAAAGATPRYLYGPGRSKGAPRRAPCRQLGRFAPRVHQDATSLCEVVLDANPCARPGHEGPWSGGRFRSQWRAEPCECRARCAAVGAGYEP